MKILLIFFIFPTSIGSIQNFNVLLENKTSRSKTKEGEVIYLGYANNPFGFSTPILNASEIQEIKYQRSKATVAYNQIIFDSIGNNVDSGLYEISSVEPRSKRGVVHLYNMVSCATGCNPLIYKGYGCFCGFLGSGYPVDGIDRCCKLHDWCYDSSKCPRFLEYFVPYYWKCFKGRPLCAVNHGKYGGPGSCAQRLCECDKALSKCISRYSCPSSRALCKTSPWRLLQNTLMIF